MLLGGIVLVLAVEHLDITVVNDITEHTDSGIPLEVLVYSTFYIARHTNQVTFVFVEDARLIGRTVCHLRTTHGDNACHNR